MVGTVSGATLSGRLMARTTHYKRPPMIGLVVAVAALLVAVAVPRGLPLWVFEVLLALASCGLGTLLPVTTVAIQNAVAPHQMGTATGSMNFFRSLGGALIVAGFGAILLGAVPASEIGRVTLETLAPTLANAGLDIAGVFRWVFAAAAAGLFITIGWLMLMEELPLRSRVGGPAAPSAAE
jgi:MFS family permease